MAVNNRARNGKIGELLVELELVKKGWHVQRLDGASMAPNGDLIVVNQSNILIIQVKTSFSCRSVYLAGHREGVNNNSYYNCAYGPVKAHFIIAVSGKPENPYFYILPIVDAERLCVENHCEWIAGRRRDGGERSQSHQIKVAPEKLEDYKDKWNLLEATRN